LSTVTGGHWQATVFHPRRGSTARTDAGLCYAASIPANRYFYGFESGFATTNTST
jgi:hypothetical protein